MILIEKASIPSNSAFDTTTPLVLLIVEIFAHICILGVEQFFGIVVWIPDLQLSRSHICYIDYF